MLDMNSTYDNCMHYNEHSYGVSDEKMNRLNVSRLSHTLSDKININAIGAQTAPYLHSVMDKVLVNSEFIAIDDYDQLTKFKDDVTHALHSLNTDTVNDESMTKGMHNTVNVITSKAVKIDHHQYKDSTDDHSYATSSVDKMNDLLNQQKSLLSKEIDDSQINNTMLTSEISELSAILKNTMIRMNESIVEQNFKVDLVLVHAVANVEEIKQQKAKMSTSEKTIVTSLFELVAILLWVLLLVVATSIVMRLT